MNKPMIYIKSLVVALGLYIGFAVVVGGGAFLGLAFMYSIFWLLLTYGPSLPHISKEVGPYIGYIILGLIFLWTLSMFAYCVRRDCMDKDGNLLPPKHWGYWGDGKRE